MLRSSRNAQAMILHQRTDRMGALVAATFALASLLLVLVLPSETLLAARNTDLVSEFVSSRAYLAESLRHGHLPLWNSFTYGGQPFLGGFESAVLYPPNLLFLCLPLPRALNFLMLLHLVILGWGTERWASCRGLNPSAAGLAGFFVMPLSGAVFPHIYAGHLPAVCTMAWAPWIFLGLETWIWQGNRRGLFLASAAICLQILAGHVQYLFYTAVAAGIQSLVVSVAEPAARRRAIPAVAGCYLTAFALGAAQLLAGLTTEGIRQRKLDYDFAAMFGFPPENFLTVIAPGFFGNLGMPVYWGRCDLWEMSLFIGAVGPLLIAIALCENGPRRRGVILDLVIAGLLLVLALGIHTPLFDLLYEFAPGFGYFRGWSKFIFPATLLLVLVVATGADFLLREKIPRTIAWLGLVAGLITGGAGFVLLVNTKGITGFLHVILMSRESYLPPVSFIQPDLIHEAGVHAGLSLGLAGLTLITAGVILLFVGKQPLLRWAIPGLLILEMIGFVAGQVTFSHVSDAMPDALRQFVRAHPGDYRVLDLAYPSNGFLLGAGDLGGNNPSPLRRYAEFINFAQGGDPDHVTQYLPFKSIVPLHAMLRLRYVFIPTSQGIRVVESRIPPLPRLLLVSDEKVLAGRSALFSAMHDPSFDPSKTALLESEPEPHPESGAIGAAKLISDLSDELVVEADTNKPTLLLITDLYDHNWHVEALPDSAQQSYHLMPADYILRAVPLAAGHHHLQIVYVPTAFSIGIGISVVAWMLWISLLVREWWRNY
ncbi:MAG: hypothetical protein JO207_00325 [Verrucomicrobia bacterium]|nr:hypothetical protein [Verrucomicrobiota bacterium]